MCLNTNISDIWIAYLIKDIILRSFQFLYLLIIRLHFIQCDYLDIFS